MNDREAIREWIALLAEGNALPVKLSDDPEQRAEDIERITDAILADEGER